VTFFWFYFLQEINDFSTRAVEACLLFMYSGELKVKSVKAVCEETQGSLQDSQGEENGQS